MSDSGEREDRNPLYPDRILGRDRGMGPWRRLGSTMAMLGGSLRRRPVPRRILSGVSILLVLGGVLLFSYPFLTNLYADWRQSRLEEQFESDETRRAYIARKIRPGDALTRIRIPRLGVDAIVVEGTTSSALRAGAGHYEQTALPCERGNAAIAGHRTTYSKPFASIEQLQDGDRVVLITPVGRCVYRVRGFPWITHPQDFSVLAQPDRATVLTLTTCNPPGSATERLIVRARLVRSELR